MTNTTSTTSELIHTWTAALNGNDPDGVAALFAPDGVLVDVGTGQRAEGPDAIRAMAAGFLGMFSDFGIEKTWELGSDDGFADEWVISGVHTGDVPGLPATGRSFRYPGACVADVRDGRITRASLYWNMADFLAQVGLMPSGD